MSNMINWFELPAQDLQRAKGFYENVLGITLSLLEIPNGPQMALFPDQDKGDVSGAIVCYPRFYFAGEEGPLMYLNANPDLQTALDRVEQNGGKIILHKRMITEERGHMAVITDSEGNRVALHSDS